MWLRTHSSGYRALGWPPRTPRWHPSARLIMQLWQHCAAHGDPAVWYATWWVSRTGLATIAMADRRVNAATSRKFLLETMNLPGKTSYLRMKPTTWWPSLAHRVGSLVIERFMTASISRFHRDPLDLGAAMAHP
ncbi:hypothetical protein ON010_g8504 [Phytophthora cinnamomi]|nr:hypothetical protein ON010_g8504 [Phytophthora cinnamomi]